MRERYPQSARSGRRRSASACRRGVLEKFVRSARSNDIDLSTATFDVREAQRWLTARDAERTDGIVAKRRDGPYLSGERAMVKVKPLRSADCVVGGFRYLANKRQVGSLLLGLYNAEGTLDHIGFTATIRNEERAALTERLEELREPPGFTGKAPGGPSRWSTDRSAAWEPLRPALVVEVRYGPGDGQSISSRDQITAVETGQVTASVYVRADYVMTIAATDIHNYLGDKQN